VTLLAAELRSGSHSAFHLTFTKELDIAEIDLALEVPHQIADLAFWPQLTSMKLSTAGYSEHHCVDSQLNLLDLSAALGNRCMILKF